MGGKEPFLVHFQLDTFIFSYSSGTLLDLQHLFSQTEGTCESWRAFKTEGFITGFAFVGYKFLLGEMRYLIKWDLAAFTINLFLFKAGNGYSLLLSMYLFFLYNGNGES